MIYTKLMEVLGTGNFVVIAFGRFNPPTSGHALLIKAAEDIGRRNHAPVIVYVSRTQDRNRNPLNPEQKINYLREMFPRVDFKIADASPPTFIGEAKALSSHYSNLIMVAGSDRVPEFQRLLNTYNGKEFEFDSVNVVSAGQRDPDSDTASGMSASKMREFAKRGNMDSFINGAAPYLSKAEAQQMYNDTRAGLGLKAESWNRTPKFSSGDQVLFENEVWTVQKAGAGYSILERAGVSKTVWNYQLKTPMNDSAFTSEQLNLLKALSAPASNGAFHQWVRSEQVEFNLDRRHGKSIGELGTAHGRNLWFFTNKPRGGVDYQNPAEFFQHAGRYCDAKDAATMWARQNGYSTVYVM